MEGRGDRQAILATLGDREPLRDQLNHEEPATVRPDPVPMLDPRRTDAHAEPSMMHRAPANLFAIRTAKQQTDVGPLVHVPWERTRNTMHHLREHRASRSLPLGDLSVELATGEMG